MWYLFFFFFFFFKGYMCSISGTYLDYLWFFEKTDHAIFQKNEHGILSSSYKVMSVHSIPLEDGSAGANNYDSTF